MEKAPERNLKKLSAKQQVALYVMLGKLKGGKNRPFLSSDFANEVRSIFVTKDDAEYQRTIGGILGALSKNSLVEKITGDRDPLWAIPEDIYKNAEKYRKEMFPVFTYWEK